MFARHHLHSKNSPSDKTAASPYSSRNALNSHDGHVVQKLEVVADVVIDSTIVADEVERTWLYPTLTPGTLHVSTMVLRAVTGVYVPVRRYFHTAMGPRWWRETYTANVVQTDNISSPHRPKSFASRRKTGRMSGIMNRLRSSQPSRGW